MRKKLRKFLHCNQTWLAVVATIALLIHNISSAYEASQFTLIANMVIGAMVYSGYLTNCEVKRDKEDTDEKHKQ